MTARPFYCEARRLLTGLLCFGFLILGPSVYAQGVNPEVLGIFKDSLDQIGDGLLSEGELNSKGEVSSERELLNEPCAPRMVVTPNGNHFLDMDFLGFVNPLPSISLIDLSSMISTDELTRSTGQPPEQSQVQYFLSSLEQVGYHGLVNIATAGKRLCKEHKPEGSVSVELRHLSGQFVSIRWVAHCGERVRFFQLKCVL